MGLLILVMISCPGSSDGASTGAEESVSSDVDGWFQHDGRACPDAWLMSSVSMLSFAFWDLTGKAGLVVSWE